VAPNFLLQFNGDVILHDVEFTVGWLSRAKNLTVAKNIPNLLCNFHVGWVGRRIYPSGQEIPMLGHTPTISDCYEMHLKRLLQYAI
jgi:hypothetical protein